MKNNKIPEQEEWDFRSVPEAEQPLCWLYEYGRDATEFKQIIAEWRERNPAVIDAAHEFLSGMVNTANPLLDWVRTSESAGYPGGFPLDDPRRFLFYFPPFPDKPWQTLETNYRLRAALLCPEMLFSGKLSTRLLLAKETFEAETVAQRAIQRECSTPIAESQIAALTRRLLEEQILAPPVVEKSEGIKQGQVGTIPPGSTRGNRPGQIVCAGFCREEVTFVINWAHPNGEIQKAFGAWLKKNRQHDDFRRGSVTKAGEHLKKLSAYRILKTGITAEAACEIDIQDPLFADARQFRRAKSEASLILKNLFGADI